MILEQSRGYQIRLMDEQAAREIVNWRYETPYALYNMLDAADDAEDIEELLDGSYFSVAAADGALIGFFCYGQNAQVGEGIESGLYLDGTSLDIGLGLRPDLTGQGRGLAFLQAGMKFAEQTYDAKRFRLSVAAFNLRAVSVYKKAGFVLLHSFVHQHGDSEMEFLLMETRDIAARL
ncbi:N-acetyltransferase GCN5 [Paenibacillus sp. FSL R7-277]|uniref:GNAT family N-acetyltransferase n=1 Tax=Paenibacillus sp. FSL R7-277 TaxID=1227352 RepID=UPI0003E2105A|nr:GNAT family N-acetyltransferase [Paenibacillus sp. FSL R7-277]ETT63587.1 N-acetyltransferase GCN5 [Paenibacillus sp. FSL R7-277]